MAFTFSMDPLELLRITDSQVLAPIETYGKPDMAKRDYLLITGNNTALATNIRNVTLTGYNDDASGATSVCLTLAGKGTSGLLFIPQLAASPTHAAWMKGAMYFNTADGKFYGNTGSAWAVIGSQS